MVLVCDVLAVQCNAGVCEIKHVEYFFFSFLQCFDTVGWVTARASGL